MLCCWLQPWLQELLDNVGDVVCAGCSDAADWGVKAVMVSCADSSDQFGYVA
jgi:hypothetical protein